ncbi:hypothetical protein ACH40D_40295 [Streptomyces olivaceoviridis]|uniref:Uncharacterized protein n=1 Tax=Streptomyces olivaceoviridis TaxID=1921 RepID=A0ABW7VME0_STROI|nr:hypothetical protein [Streptomyces corchorusii]
MAKRTTCCRTRTGKTDGAMTAKPTAAILLKIFASLATPQEKVGPAGSLIFDDSVSYPSWK